ncbi:hypothetical protein GLOIN_2v1776486 [Rhizophagus irregularis DAOM 181602=DAOM 197198]|uniref:Uncharacterized protein n=1 Tax=Rhizophagus irregularis (strain DAOM 181602 / DAOM 197198 / MUCL 43194) TaxID=747089 RepID=A0A2P4PX02_RHIID|nr:hypothetical protein GLOIN_2v1776486 [Rhizophagus irregularis DAOM 181602=DAOM 197198]POG69921.1 hypothetical protein GLOIN_2v1776486 [Rhizophagus irregularis DAOM 181602=DAOM 197198]|eukprot:XP_025176787.1 hypothetical protein GLOIN_2v1776486 [Rhizophagus irregularis DAOM 181602=DAOM 197198]
MNNDLLTKNISSKKVHFASRNNSSTQQSDDFQVNKELYFDAMDQLEIESTSTPVPTSSSKPASHIGSNKEVVKEFTNLNEDFSKRLPLRPLISIKPKDDNLSSDDSDETKDSNKKKRKKKKAITRGDIVSDSE